VSDGVAVVAAATVVELPDVVAAPEPLPPPQAVKPARTAVQKSKLDPRALFVSGVFATSHLRSSGARILSSETRFTSVTACKALASSLPPFRIAQRARRWG
jgi:hypothetical protein